MILPSFSTSLSAKSEPMVCTAKRTPALYLRTRLIMSAICEVAARLSRFTMEFSSSMTMRVYPSLENRWLRTDDHVHMRML